MMKDIEVWLGYDAPSEQQQEIGNLFGEEEIPVEVRTPVAPPQIGDGAGFTVEVFILSSTVGAFLTAYFGAAGVDAWRKTKGLLQKLQRDHKERFSAEGPAAEGLLVFKDVERRIQVNLRADMPDEAFGKLFELEIGDREQVAYDWNDESREWEATDLSPYEDWSHRTRDDLRFRLRRLRRRIFQQ